MRRTRSAVLVAVITVLTGCRAHVRAESAAVAAAQSREHPRLAQVYYWKARPGMLEQYNRYIAEVAEPIDAEAQRQDAFISITTYMTRDTLSPWTHMRIFVLRDSAQLRGLGAALDAAGRRLEPDSVKRRVRGEYAATLRDRVGGTVLEIVP